MQWRGWRKYMSLTFNVWKLVWHYLLKTVYHPQISGCQHALLYCLCSFNHFLLWMEALQCLMVKLCGLQDCFKEVAIIVRTTASWSFFVSFLFFSGTKIKVFFLLFPFLFLMNTDNINWHNISASTLHFKSYC